MMNNYIEKSVKFRMGKWYESSFTNSLCDWENTQIIRKNPQYKYWINYFNDLGFKKNPGVLFDSQDCFINKKNIVNKPIIVYNRPVYDDCGGILFAIDRNPTKNLFDDLNDPHDWSKKDNKIFWRGQLSGFLKKTDPPFSDQICTVNLWQNLENDLDKCLRVNFVKKHGKSHDIRFSSFDVEKKWVTSRNLPLLTKNKKILKQFIRKHKYAIADKVPFTDFLKHKYLLDLDGSNAPGSTINILKSNSVMLRPIPVWETIIFMDLKPWVHYVPIEYDASDLNEKLKWCENNDAECKQISENATDYIKRFTPDSENKINTMIIEKLFVNSNK